MSLVVIVPAAGSGSRFGGPLAKQFQLLAGQPILQHVLARFLSLEPVSRVIVPVSEQVLATIEEPVSARLVWLQGGATRQQSVIRAMTAAQDAELVAVHDAVRPLFTAAMFHAVVEAARETGAALPVVPVTDTIHLMNDDATIAQTLDRTMLGAAQTPQCFHASLLREILTRAAHEGVEGTDEAGLAARYGYRVKAVPGDPRNLKITRPEDLAAAELYLREWSER